LRVVKGLLAIAVIFGIAFLIVDADWATGERTVYRVNCKGGAGKGSKCATPLVPSTRVAYKTKFGDPQIVYWELDGPNENRLFAMTNCLVRDAENWQCAVGIRMVDGRVLNESGEESFPQVPRLVWRALQIAAWFR
jgi:hypothetical protein